MHGMDPHDEINYWRKRATEAERLTDLARAYVAEIDAKRYSTAQYVLTALVEVVRREGKGEK
jgi:hypothetical protein